MTTVLRKRVIYGLGIPLLVLNAWFGTYAYVVVQALLWTQTSLLRGPIFWLFLLALWNLAARRIAPRLTLTTGEMITLYAMVTLETCAQGIGFVQILVHQMAGAIYYGNADNGWDKELWPHIPDWLALRDSAALNGFFRGNSTFYNLDTLRAWAIPVLAWGTFLFAIFWTLFCIMTLLRHHWAEEERLTFPLVQLPLHMVQATGITPDGTPFWRNSWMWAGFLLAGGLESVNFLNFLFPSIPSIPIKPVGPNQLEDLFTVRPWSEMGMLRLAFYPFAIGIGYLLSLDISFSCWFFYLGTKVVNVASAALGFGEGGGSGPANRMPFLQEQSVGAFLALAGWMLWSARSVFVRTFQGILSGSNRDNQEMMSYRRALIGGGVGILFLTSFLTFAGLAFPVAVLFVLVYLCFSLTLARIVSEAGAGWAWGPEWGASGFTSDAIGSQNLPQKSLVILNGYTSWMRDMCDNPMPQEFHGAQLGRAASVSAPALLKPLLCALILGIALAFWAHLDIYYRFGAATAKVRPWLSTFGTAPFNATMATLQNSQPSDIPGLIAAGVGASIVAGLSLLRQRLTLFPFHPLGFALATTQSMQYMWCPFFLAWGMKAITLRYGGIRAYRAALPFFLGLILGDYIVPIAWGAFGMLSDTQQYMAFPH